MLNDVLVNVYFFGLVFVGVEIGIGLIWGWYPEETYSLCFIWINMLYKYSYYNSEEKFTLFFLPITMKIIYYPFVMTAFVFVQNLEIRYDALFGLVLAIIECRFFNGGMILFVKDTYEDKEKAMKCLGFAGF